MAFELEVRKFAAQIAQSTREQVSRTGPVFCISCNFKLAFGDLGNSFRFGCRTLEFTVWSSPWKSLYVSLTTWYYRFFFDVRISNNVWMYWTFVTVKTVIFAFLYILTCHCICKVSIYRFLSHQIWKFFHMILLYDTNHWWYWMQWYLAHLVYFIVWIIGQTIIGVLIIVYSNKKQWEGTSGRFFCRLCKWKNGIIFRPRTMQTIIMWLKSGQW